MASLGSEHEGDSNPFRLEDIVLAEDVDYVLLRARIDSRDFHDAASRGEPCSRAAGSDSCRAAILDLQRRVERAQVAGEPVYVITETRGKVRAWVGTQELKQLLGPLDRASEARLWLFANTKLWPECGLALAACEQPAGDGYELRSQVRGPCGVTILMHRVSSSGRIEQVQKTTTDAARQCKTP